VKVLVIASHVTHPTEDNYNRSYTGYGKAVYDHCYSASLYDIDIHVIGISNFTKGFQDGRLRFIRKTYRDILNSFSFRKVLITLWSLRWLYIKSFKLSIRLMFSAIQYGFIKNLVEQENYDRIVLHGASVDTIPYFYFSFHEVPHITLHGFLKGEVGVMKVHGDIEDKFMQYVNQWTCALSAVSRGVIIKVKRHYSVVNTRVIYNPLPAHLMNAKISALHNNLREGVCCVGNLSRRKNQIQLYRLWDFYLRPLMINCIVAGEFVNGELKPSMSKEGFVLTGKLTRAEIMALFGESKLNIVFSLSEGFGLSVIEALYMGVPTLMYSDLDAFKDFKNLYGVIGIERTMPLDSIRNIVIELLKTDWDQVKMRTQLEVFNPQNVGLRLKEFYSLNA